MHHQRRRQWRKPKPMASPYDVPPDAKFVGPWASLTGEFGSPEDNEAVMLECDRLVRELGEQYPMFAAAMPEVVARRSDTNMFLYHFRKPSEIKVGGYPFAVFARTSTGQYLFGYYEQWAEFEEEMTRDAADPSR